MLINNIATINDLINNKFRYNYEYKYNIKSLRILYRKYLNLITNNFLKPIKEYNIEYNSQLINYG